MRAQSDDDLAAALPPSLTVDMQLPEPIHEAPPEEAVVALEAVPGPATTTISPSATSIT